MSNIRRLVCTGLLVLAAACNPQTPGASGQSPTQPGPWAANTGWPQGPQQPQPGWVQPGAPMPPQPMPSQPGWSQQPTAPAAFRAPQGMRPVSSQAGYVFVSEMNGSNSAHNFAQAVISSVSDGFFDGPPQVTGANGDPNDRTAQVMFQASLRGAPVVGMISAVSNGRGAGKGYLLFDAPQSISQTGPMMMNAVGADMQGAGVW